MLIMLRVNYITDVSLACVNVLQQQHRHEKSATWETFWMAGEHFGPKFMWFCRIVKFVGNYRLV